MSLYEIVLVAAAHMEVAMYMDKGRVVALVVVGDCSAYPALL